MNTRTHGRMMLGAALGCLLLLGACGGGGEQAEGSLRDILQVVDDHADELVALKGVSAVGVGVMGPGQACVRIYVVELTDELRDRLPAKLEGHPVDIEVSGEFVPVEKSDGS